MEGWAALSRLLPALLLGAAAGAVLHRADFCLAAAFRDLFLFRRTFLLRCLVLYAGAAALLLEGARLLGLLPTFPFPFAPASAALLGGGLLFGLGMAVAGGCVTGTLTRAAAGTGPAIAAMAGIVAGSGAFAEIYSPWSALHAATLVPPSGAVTAAEAFSLPPWALSVPAALACLAASALGWGNLRRRSAVTGYLQPRSAALLLALLTAASCLLLGRPMGVTTTLTRIAARLAAALYPAHAASLEYFRLLAEHGGEGLAWSSAAALQGALVAGIAGGAFASALSVGEFRLRWRVPARQYALSLAGGVLMGISSRMAFGCNVWHVLGGVPVLATGSLLFAAALLPGAWAGGKIQLRLL